MSDGFPDRLTQLRARWQGDPSSRVFLQLAEEYRHLGRVQEALEVLDRGLKEHPGYLSALVAKGRCLLELGDASGARQVLERVVQQDATQMVANKLLVRACLDLGDPEGARRRLDLYSLLNDSDPEIDELRRRVVAMSRSGPVADDPLPADAAERSPMQGSGTPEGSTAEPAEVFDLGPAEPVRPFHADDSIFDLGAPPLPAAPAHGAHAAHAFDTAVPAPEAPLFELPAVDAAPRPEALAAAVPPAFAAAAPAAAAADRPAPRGQGNDAEPFPDLAPEHSFHAYLTSLAAEQIFAFESPARPAAAQVDWRAPRAERWLPPVSDLAPAPAAEPAAPIAAPVAVAVPVEPAPVEYAPAEAAPAAAPAGAIPAAKPAGAIPPAAPAGAAPVGEPAAAATEPSGAIAVFPAAQAPAAIAAPGTLETATLGELYLRQGHLGEAERIFREVMERDPGNDTALAALAEIERRRQPLDARHLLAGLDDPDASPAVRKAYLLQSYLARLRQVRRPHVS